ncbi:alkaline phosphatase D family protein [uncultured Polaribacter sp.]|uniref:alkaline phosphatase D family protein n=1 Tax=uncultured Polaribacter sp. TaxID=174711 RepID=UPI0026047237|nr:alkaline phosphatase D family protein [uncultured Polaribacter sp.]
MKIKSFFFTVICLSIITCQIGCDAKKSNQKTECFPYGVASGNSASNSVLLWTKTTLEYIEQKVHWQISTDSLFTRIHKEGFKIAKEENDFTIKIKVDGLSPSTFYYYRFFIDKKSLSTLGRTKTLPAINEMPENFSIALVNCNNFQDGYFNAFEALSKRDDVDLVIHLGDYIYEYEAGRYADTTLVNRLHKPSHEIVTLNDYRTRYSQYRSEIEFQNLHAKFPFLFIWDDHEFANDAYAKGAKNHSEEEGVWKDRQANAIKAYMEWMPIYKSPEKNPPHQIQIGQLIDLLLLEERASARTKQINPCELNEKDVLEHTLLGKKQMNTLVNTIENSNKVWTVIANQVAFTGYSKVDSLFSLKYKDWWLGYPNDRNQVISAFKKATNKPIILTGDHHCSFVMALHDDHLDSCKPKYISEHNTKPLAWEIMVPSVSSKNYDAYPDSIVNNYSKKLVNPKYNPHIKFADLNNHGFTIMHFNQNTVQAEYVFMETIKKKDATIRETKTFNLTY